MSKPAVRKRDCSCNDNPSASAGMSIRCHHFSVPVIYVITPTYRRPEQIAELTRLSQTLSHVPAIRWILVEDSDSLSSRVTDLLRRLSFPYTHLHGKVTKKQEAFVHICLSCMSSEEEKYLNYFWFNSARMPEEYRNMTPFRPRGVSNRNAGLEWIRRHAPDSTGVIYFADDDNSYDVRLFDEVYYRFLST